MRAHPCPKTWRALRTELRNLGARDVRTSGSHETWRFDDGETFIVIRNHLAHDVPVGILAKFRRVRARRRALVGEEPAPLGLAEIVVISAAPSFEKGRFIMTKGSSGSRRKGSSGSSGAKGGGSSSSGGKGGGVHTPGAKGGGAGGNWPSTRAGQPSGRGRGNAPSSR
ncbi:MAG: type II toxin-antitoxin system HicA family toxin [Deltaproteobacteria bacterium]|nr:type II toxin-antitoxin system HicA family toxin [Deltaproteobacteria bacterium]